jgi:predicted nucleotidyltransferase
MNEIESQLLKNIKSAVLSCDPDATVYLFGSRARGDSRPDSDWDILVLLGRRDADTYMKRLVRKKLYRLELESDQPISTFVFSSGEWLGGQRHTPFYQSVNAEGIRI